VLERKTSWIAAAVIVVIWITVLLVLGCTLLRTERD
jgi:hypothetical protein